MLPAGTQTTERCKMEELTAKTNQQWKDWSWPLELKYTLA